MLSTPQSAAAYLPLNHRYLVWCKQNDACLSNCPHGGEEISDLDQEQSYLMPLKLRRCRKMVWRPTADDKNPAILQIPDTKTP